MLRKAPGNDILWRNKALAHAMLGERSEAMAAHAQKVAWAKNESPWSAELASRELPEVLALLGEIDEAISALKRQVHSQYFFVHDIRVSLPYASLWDNPQFKAFVDDPASNAPITFDSGNPR